jgi:hypothetical protein
MRHVRNRDAYGRDALAVLLIEAVPELAFFIGVRVADPGQAEDLARNVLAAVLQAYDRGSHLRLEHGSASFYEY